MAKGKTLAADPWDKKTLLESLDDAFPLYEMRRENRQVSRLLKERAVA